LGMDLVPDRAPSLERSFAAELLAELDPAVEGDPGHHLRVGEVSPPAAHLPDAFVGLAPALLEQPEHVPAELPCRQRSAIVTPTRLIQRAQLLAVAFELLLCGCGVADPDRRRAVEAG